MNGVGPAKKQRRQRTTAATASQAARARAVTSAGKDPQMRARQRPAQPGPRGAAGQLPKFYAPAAPPRQDDSLGGTAPPAGERGPWNSAPDPPRHAGRNHALTSPPPPRKRTQEQTQDTRLGKT